MLLHTEVMRQHLLVSQDHEGRWRLSGLIDFTLTSYGYHRDELDPGLRRRLLAWGLLHRYSNLNWWMERLPQPARPTLDALADRWFATD